MTDLCIILRDIYRNAFGPRSAKSDRNNTLSRADDALARWSLMLPHPLRLRPTLTLELWPSTLHLIYNTALILFHRPRPHLTTLSSSSSLPSANDAEICSAAAGTIQAIFESLAESKSLSSLWVFSVTALFTAMIQLSAEVRFSNPLLAIAAVLRYDSTLYSLRKLSLYWPNAQSILHFFENSERLQREGLHAHSQPQSSPRLHTYPVESEAGIEQQNRNETRRSNDWRHLFPFTEPLESAVPGNDFLENWQEMYWQEPFELGEDFGCF
jgi:transcriptional regulatory protein AMDR